MSEEQKIAWENLYYYVKNLLGYDENQALSSTMVLRLKGLSTNKFIENGNIKDGANYSYEVILNTFKFCSIDIKNTEAQAIIGTYTGSSVVMTFDGLEPIALKMKCIASIIFLRL